MTAARLTRTTTAGLPGDGPASSHGGLSHKPTVTGPRSARHLTAALTLILAPWSPR